MNGNFFNYDEVWSKINIQRPEIWPIWKIIKEVAGEKNLEIGSGNYPRIPIKRGYIVDTSRNAILNLKKVGFKAFWGDAKNLNFQNNFFDLVAAFNVLEHVDNDQEAFSEITRVLKPGGFFIFSVPLNPKKFSEFDSIVGHKRRYEINKLIEHLVNNDLRIVKYRPASIVSKIYCGWLVNNSLFSDIIKAKIFQKWLSSGPPQPFSNLISIFQLLMEKISIPGWQNNFQGLKELKEGSVILLCQKEKELREKI